MVEAFISRAEMLVQKTARKNLLSLTLFEKVTAFVMIMGIVILMIATVYTRSNVSKVNAEIEKVTATIQTKTVENQILQQKIDDMMTYDRISDIAKKYGLSVSLQNVRTIVK